MLIRRSSTVESPPAIDCQSSLAQTIYYYLSTPSLPLAVSDLAVLQNQYYYWIHSFESWFRFYVNLGQFNNMLSLGNLGIKTGPSLKLKLCVTSFGEFTIILLFYWQDRQPTGKNRILLFPYVHTLKVKTYIKYKSDLI